jgi:tetratricopeptide (TPR) repeat protein
MMRIGGYEVLGELGRGGMGVVYRVSSPGGGEAALKLLPQAGPEAFARYERERRLLASLGQDEGFVGLLDAGRSPEGAWLVMPLVPGGTLRDRLERGPLGVDETIALGIQLAKALGAAHERGVVHRDVKPENVLFASDGRALLSDLGVARHFDRLAAGASQSRSLTRSGVLVGTAGYLAPEQLADATSAGPPADIFALGAVLHEGLAGRPAFCGATVLEMLDRLGSCAVEPIGRAEVPAWLEAVIVRAMARDPRARFADGAALARALSGRGALVSRRQPLALTLVVGAATGAFILAAGSVALIRSKPGPGASPPERRPAPPVSPQPEATPRVSARDLCERAHENAMRGYWGAAIADYSNAIRLDPTLAAAWSGRGWARGHQDDWAGVIADYSKAIELAPTLPAAWINRGEARGKQGDIDGEIADETRALELDATLAAAWANRGEARGRKLDWDGAISDATRALERAPGLAGAWGNRGYARAAKGDSDGAIADCSKAIELIPTLAMAWAQRGGARGTNGDMDGAVADCSRAIELDPKLAVAWAFRGAARVSKNDDDEGIRDLSTAIELDPRLSLAVTNRAAARRKGGDLKGAISDYERALELDPASSDAARVRGRLDEARQQLEHPR